MYADIIVNISSLDKSFQYLVPEELAEQIEIGSAVRVPLGKSEKLREGFVIGLSKEPKIEKDRIKPIGGLAEKKNPIEGRLIRLAAWMRVTYGSTMQQALTAVLPVKDRKKSRSRTEELEEIAAESITEEEPPLVTDQVRALEAIREEWKNGKRPVLLQGVTGSGKTRLYMELTEEVLAQGKQAIILIPEIALSWQTVRRFRRRFGDIVTVMHSRMSGGERSRQFDRMRAGEAQVVIGPRSALFAPFSDLGLIVVDEEQESSYQSESAPRYDAREAALFRGKEEDARVLFGSATPSVDSRYRAEQGIYELVRLENRIGESALPAVTIVDMREEKKAGNLSLISRHLEESIRKRLAEGEQSMLFLNRRGFSGVHTCQSCGHVIQCAHCNISLTLHTNGRLVCHYCGYSIPLPKACPSCGSPHIRGFRYGTQKVENDLRRLFPDARVLRMDADSTRHKGDYAEILGTFSRREADILIGTQMIVKGHDFPGVTLVGILAADLSLFANDYRAQERTYQLLVQAVGRSGRGEQAGEAIIQTLHPEHECIQQAVAQAYDRFFEDEITTRDLAGYPPAKEMLAIHGASENEAQLHTAMEALYRFLNREQEVPEEDLIGPAPEVVSRRKNVFLEVLYIRTDEPQRLIRLRRMAEKYIAINSGFRDIRFSYERNL